MNNVTGEHQALPEEMLTKIKVLFAQSMLWLESRHSGSSSLSYTSTSQIPYPIPPRVDYYREYPPHSFLHPSPPP